MTWIVRWVEGMNNGLLCLCLVSWIKNYKGFFLLWILDRMVSRKQRSFLFMHLGSFGSCVTLRTDYDFVMIVLWFWVVFDILGFFCCFPDFLVLNFSWGLTALWHISPPSCIHFLLMMVLWWSFCFWNVIIFLIGFFFFSFFLCFYPWVACFELWFGVHSLLMS